MFSNCNSFNQEIAIPKNVVNASYMFADSPNMISNIYINGNPEVNYIVTSKNKSRVMNIFVTSLFDKNMVMMLNGNKTYANLQPLSDGNGYFSANYNCYIYNNYVAI